MFEIKVKIRHGCPYLDIANLFDAPVYSFCSELYDLMTIPKRLTASEIASIEEYVVDLDSLEIVPGKEENSVSHVYFRCMCQTETSVSPKIQKNGGIVEHPIIYDEGWEHYTIICLNEKSQASVLKHLQTIEEEYELVSIKDLGRDGIFKSQFVSMHQLVNTLTERQIEVIVKAYEEGYYEIPRTVTTEELASGFGVSRTATEKSLRKAENGIIQTIIPYLAFHKKIHEKSSDPRKIRLLKGL